MANDTTERAFAFHSTIENNTIQKKRGALITTDAKISKEQTNLRQEVISEVIAQQKYYTAFFLF